jgi:hypothetical protein
MEGWTFVPIGSPWDRIKPLGTFTLISCSAYSTVKMEAICSSETSVDFQRTTRRCIAEDSVIHVYINSYVICIVHVLYYFHT